MKGRPVTITTKLKRGDRGRLEDILSRRGEPHVRAQRARTLLLLSEGRPPKETGEIVGTSRDTVLRVRKRYLESGLERALDGEVRVGSESPYSETQRQQIVAIACSAPPEGVSHWNCQLLAEEAISRGVVESIGRESIRIILESHELKPWREKNVVRSKTR